MFSLSQYSILIVVLSTLAFTTAAQACRCKRPPEPKQALEQASVVFAGKVIEIKQVNRQNHVTFEVLKIWKGEIGKKVTVATSISSAACGYSFTKQGDGTYMVYCNHSKKTKQIWTNICTRTRTLANAAKDVKELGDGRAPK